MQKWEYRRIRVQGDEVDDLTILLDAYLTELGEVNWELAGIACGQDWNYHILYFKRPKITAFHGAT